MVQNQSVTIVAAEMVEVVIAITILYLGVEVRISCQVLVREWLGN
jgi:hypothetical protein